MTHGMRHHRLPLDPALPQLATALDGAAMAELFEAELREHGQRVEACEVERVKYRPRRNASVAYRLRLRDATSLRCHDQRVSARLCSGGDSLRRAAEAGRRRLTASPAGPALRLLPELDMVTWWWPNDPKLAAARWLADARVLNEQLLPAVVAALGGPDARLVDHELQTIQVVPEQRLTVRLDLRWRHLGKPVQQACVFGKSSLEPDSAQAHALLAEIQSSAAWREGRLRTPAALLSQPNHALHWQLGMRGVPLADLPAARRAALAPALGAQVAALHGTPLSLAPEWTPALLRERLERAVALLALVLPDNAPTLARLAERLADGLAEHGAGEPATLHGDLHPRNILVDGDALALIDLDAAQRGPAVLDLGGWVAEGIARAVFAQADPAADAAAAQALLTGYAAAGGRYPTDAALAWATAWQLLVERAWRCVVNLKPGRFALAPRLIAHALDLVQHTERSPA